MHLPISTFRVAAISTGSCGSSMGNGGSGSSAGIGCRTRSGTACRWGIPSFLPGTVTPLPGTVTVPYTAIVPDPVSLLVPVPVSLPPDPARPFFLDPTLLLTRTHFEQIKGLGSDTLFIIEQAILNATTWDSTSYVHLRAQNLNLEPLNPTSQDSKSETLNLKSKPWPPTSYTDSGS